VPFPFWISLFLYYCLQKVLLRFLNTISKFSIPNWNKQGKFPLEMTCLPPFRKRVSVFLLLTPGYEARSFLNAWCDSQYCISILSNSSQNVISRKLALKPECLLKYRFPDSSLPFLSQIISAGAQETAFKDTAYMIFKHTKIWEPPLTSTRP
jgi:hypothetical protein